MTGLREADVVVVGPAPPLRGGIAEHTSRLVEALERRGLGAVAVSYRRLYPASLFPGRDQRDPRAARPQWCEERLDVLDPRTWLRLRQDLSRTRARVVFQWWHPVVAPALAVVAGGVGAGRLVLVCHNLFPHERMPGSLAAARAVFGRCGRVVFHSKAERSAGERAIAAIRSKSAHVALPCLVPPAALAATAVPAELRHVAPGARLVAAVGHVRRYKGIGSLVRAWRASRRPADALLMIAGEWYLGGRDRREVLAEITADNSIILLDRYVTVEELVYIIRSVEFLLLPHASASQSGVLPLAAAVGTPVIVSDAGGLPEQAGSCPRAVVVPAGDEHALRVAIEECFGAPPCGRPLQPRADERVFDDHWQRVIEAITIENRP